MLVRHGGDNKAEPLANQGETTSKIKIWDLLMLSLGIVEAEYTLNQHLWELE